MTTTKLNKEEKSLLTKKLEYNWRKKNNDTVQNLLGGEGETELNEEQKTLIYSKLESRFKKSDNPIIGKLKS